jgi:hypothetical protein
MAPPLAAPLATAASGKEANECLTIQRNEYVSASERPEYDVALPNPYPKPSKPPKPPRHIAPWRLTDAYLHQTGR